MPTRPRALSTDAALGTELYAAVEDAQERHEATTRRR